MGHCGEIRKLTAPLALEGPEPAVRRPCERAAADRTGNYAARRGCHTGHGTPFLGCGHSRIAGRPALSPFEHPPPGHPNTVGFMKTALLLAAALVCAGALSGCSPDVRAMTPQNIEQQYGVSGAYTDTVATSDGSLPRPLVPLTLADGR